MLRAATTSDEVIGAQSRVSSGASDPWHHAEMEQKAVEGR